MTDTIASQQKHPDIGLFLFTRFPHPGLTKTRLIPALGKAGAAQLQEQMTVHLFDRCQKICKTESIQLQIHFAGGSLQQMQAWLGNRTTFIPPTFIPQCEGNLGDRIISALNQGFSSGLKRIIIIGSDCPQIEQKHIKQTVEQLNNHDLVLGPATDGGYYLVGLKQLWLPLFQDVPWSTEQLLDKTLAIAKQLNLSTSLLKTLSDIDRPEDLFIWEQVSKS